MRGVGGRWGGRFLGMRGLGKGFFLIRFWGGFFAFRGFLFFRVFLFSRRSARVAPVRGGTYFSLQRQRKVGKRKPLTPPVPATVHPAPHQVVAPEHPSLRTFELSDKAVILPAARFARRGKVCKGNPPCVTRGWWFWLCPSGRVAPPEG
ncbi:hypothetical protein PUN4_390017 [Paraburkholderia unamae]|nr:hypothetical protein PUN4_390017 [Paraburkholderia unamae]